MKMKLFVNILLLFFLTQKDARSWRPYLLINYDADTFSDQITSDYIRKSELLTVIDDIIASNIKDSSSWYIISLNDPDRIFSCINKKTRFHQLNGTKIVDYRIRKFLSSSNLICILNFELENKLKESPSSKTMSSIWEIAYENFEKFKIDIYELNLAFPKRNTDQHHGVSSQKSNSGSLPLVYKKVFLLILSDKSSSDITNSACQMADNLSFAYDGKKLKTNIIKSEYLRHELNIKKKGELIFKRSIGHNFIGTLRTKVKMDFSKIDLSLDHEPAILITKKKLEEQLKKTLNIKYICIENLDFVSRLSDDKFTISIEFKATLTASIPNIQSLPQKAQFKFSSSFKNSVRLFNLNSISKTKTLNVLYQKSKLDDFFKPHVCSLWGGERILEFHVPFDVYVNEKARQ